jgi:CBS domain-containing protein
LIKSVLKEFFETPILEVMRVSGYMLLPEDTSIIQAFEILIEHDRIWVESEKGSRKLSGVLTRKDVLDMLLPPQLDRSAPGYAQIKTLHYDGAELLVGDLMGRRLITIGERARVLEALQLMRADFVRRIPVVQKGIMLGEISMKDLIEKFVEIYNLVGSDDSGKT